MLLHAHPIRLGSHNPAPHRPSPKTADGVIILGPRKYGDGDFFPIETPESRQHLQEMCAGLIIARVCWDIGEAMPDLASGFGLEFSSGERLVILALPVQEGAFLARLIWRWIPAQHIWTKSMRRHFGTDRKSAEEKPPDFLQNQIEGQMIRGVLAPKAHVGLGERLDFELTDASLVRIEAIPSFGSDRADLDIQRVDRRHRDLWTHR